MNFDRFGISHSILTLKVASADHQLCKSLFQTLNSQSHNIDVNQWFPNELQLARNEFRQDISNTANECLNQIPEEDENNAKARETISIYSNFGQGNIESGLHILGRKLYLIYNDIIAARSPFPTSDGYQKTLQPYMNEFHFIKLCSNDFEIVRSWTEATKNIIRRVRNIHSIESAISPSAPVEFTLVFVPYLLEDIDADTWDKANENGPSGFIDKIEHHFLQIISNLIDEVCEEIKMSAVLLLTSFKISTGLPDAVKEKLNNMMLSMLGEVENSINALNNDVSKELKAELYAFFTGEAKPYLTMSSICHNNGNEIARRLNQIGTKNVDDFITLYESVFGL